MAVENAGTIEAWNTILFDKFLRYRDALTRGLSIHGDRLIEWMPPAPGSRVLDVGSGFGDMTLQLARLVGPEGRAIGVDCAQRFVESARLDASRSGSAAEFSVADVQSDDLGGPYDAVYARFGTMFFVSPVAAFKNLHRHLVPGGRLGMAVWRKREDNAWLYDAQLAVRAIIPEEEEAADQVTCGPGPFSMISPDLVSAQLQTAGFVDVTFRRCDAEVLVGTSVDQFVEIAMDIGPAGEIVRLAGEHGQAKKPEIVAALRRVAARYQRDDGAYAPSSSWLVTARRP